MAVANIQPLVDQVTANNAIVDSATILINGIADRMQAAVDAAIALGASQAELVPLTTEIALMKSKADALSAAVLANTPAAPTP